MKALVSVLGTSALRYLLSVSELAAKAKIRLFFPNERSTLQTKKGGVRP